ncbi:hypothetical protein J1N35_034132 [Gossypium stocksii]|uniref:Endonuclease/exonuclease/phosphatase domain-containing protein n=1 Tax=Gossypium stocksii TaxID=47602 RepID=A0A9D3URG2_9ROSI|nr:hypothetical protein J1N35_034132 [Gossypium stocksii]
MITQLIRTKLCDIVSGANKKGLEKPIGLGDLQSLVSSKTYTTHEIEESGLQQKGLSSDSHDAIPPNNLKATHPSTSSVKVVARPSNAGNTDPFFFSSKLNHHSGNVTGKGQMEPELPSLKKADHVVVFNPEVGDEVPRGSYSADGNHSKGSWKNQIAKKADSKGGWELNKTLKGLSNRFKISENSRVSFADSMKRVANLISTEIEEQSAKDLSRHLKEEMGCASGKFLRAFREYNNQHKPNIISLLEPHISGTKVDLIIAKLGWDKSHRVEAIGLSGGIWIGWKNLINLKVFDLLPRSILVAFVYISPDKMKRKVLWNDLSSSVPVDEPWMAIGDFNTILSLDDKKCGYVKGRRCQFFGDFMYNAHLHDLGFQGPPFTWHRGNLSERLDKVLHHHNFTEFLKENWNFDGTMASTIAGFTDKLKNWNKCVYGHIS